jgi:hypothetical protein
VKLLHHGLELRLHRLLLRERSFACLYRAIKLLQLPLGVLDLFLRLRHLLTIGRRRPRKEGQVEAGAQQQEDAARHRPGGSRQ